MQKIDLDDITKKCPDVEYHPDQFTGLVFKLRILKISTLIFTLGKMVCTGAKHETDVYRSVNNLYVMPEEEKLMIYD